MAAASEWLRGLTSLFFPNVCLNCQVATARSTDLLCVGCEARLPLRDSWRQLENDVTDRLAGRLPLQYGAAAYTFREGTVCQQLIHALKYHHRPDVGRQLGRHFGEVLRQVPALGDVTGLVPVPIHRRRRHARGYNQAEAIAEGLGEVLAKPVHAGALRRRSFRGSQTRRGKLGRLENVQDSFAVGRGDHRGGHLVLVDDVLTTGATVDFCGNVLLEHHPGVRISVLVLAVAER
ncbi:ComF family protein [Neolewinella sp.]|uniref:ComF family protein n=1 Tax=Neolewinella sp. TaxID=2993543 RepID=UPI003B51B985